MILNCPRINYKAKKNDFDIALIDIVELEELSKASLEFHYVKRALATASAIVYTDWILIRRQEYRLFLL